MSHTTHILVYNMTYTTHKLVYIMTYMTSHTAWHSHNYILFT